MTIVLDLAPEQEERLRDEASAQGMTPAGYLTGLAGLGSETPDVAAWEAMLYAFEEGDDADHRETLALLKRVVDEDRPGQRRVFGSGYNPPLPLEADGSAG